MHQSPHVSKHPFQNQLAVFDGAGSKATSRLPIKDRRGWDIPGTVSYSLHHQLIVMVRSSRPAVWECLGCRRCVYASAAARNPRNGPV
jgi:hypothetical protein